jgi:hypothetical protein
MNEPSLIPDAYVKERKEIRRTIFGVLLFVVVMSGVVAAFFVTNKQWDSIHERQKIVALRFEEVASKIARMEELRGMRDNLVERAELASALVSRLPKSILLDGLVTRMPPRVSWSSLVLSSKEIMEQVTRGNASNDRLKPRGPKAVPVRTRGPKGEANSVEERPRPKRYETTVTLTGLAPDEVDVSMYVAALQGFSMIKSVMPDSTDLVEIEDVPMRRFTITMKLDSNTYLPDFTEIADSSENGSIDTPLRVTSESDEGMVD